MHIKTAEFVKSCTGLQDCPESDIPEYAFIGRSNVGKSSLINMLVNRKGLAMTSAKPGKTLLINYFAVNGQWYIVDLPGYGYASVDKSTREKLKRMIDGYVVGRGQLSNLFVLVDSRHEPQKADLAFMEFLGEHGVPFSIVFTKADKLSAGRLNSNIEAYKDVLSRMWEPLPPVFVTSSENKTGRDELLAYIEEINKSL